MVHLQSRWTGPLPGSGSAADDEATQVFRESFSPARRRRTLLRMAGDSGGETQSRPEEGDGVGIGDVDPTDGRVSRGEHPNVEAVEGEAASEGDGEERRG